MPFCRRYSNFTVLLITAALSLVGIWCARGLNLRYTPAPSDRSLRVWVTLADATPAVMEAEVTSRIEGVLSGMEYCKSLSSTSSKGTGSVTIEFYKGVDMQAARFEAATRLANLWPSLPIGTSYPYLSRGSGGGNGGVIIWRLRSPLPPGRIAAFARENLIYPLSGIAGVTNVGVSGDTPSEWVVTYDCDKTAALGITGPAIAEAISSQGRNDIAGLWQSNGRINTVRLLYGAPLQDGSRLYDIMVPTPSGRSVRLGEIADISCLEAEPESYFRLNGLNTVTLYADISGEANILSVSSALRSEMSRLAGSVIPEEISVDLGYDSSDYVASELRKILLRTALCLLVLLIFSFLIKRSWRQMAILLLSLSAGLLMSMAVYRLVGLPIHIYTLAGITVSFGIMIDTAILMTDHYERYRDRKAFPSIVYAVATTVAALLLVMLLPEEERAELPDFILAVSINLCVSLLTGWFLVPALVDVFGQDGPHHRHHHALRRLASLRALYGRYIAWGTHHRWVYIVALVLSFGLPVYLIPQEHTLSESDTGIGATIARWKPYSSHRNTINTWLGSLSGLFARSLARADMHREPIRTILSIRAGMPEGCTVAQLDIVVRQMENFLSQFEGIESYTTSVRSYNDASIEVRFRPDVEHTSIPSEIKARATSAAINFGGANWSVVGVNESYFDNNIVTDHKPNRITLIGYNYNKLRDYADLLVERLSENKRVTAPEVWAGALWGRPQTELYVHYNRQALAASNVSINSYYNALTARLWSSSAGTVHGPDGSDQIVVRSSDADDFDLWHMAAKPIAVDSTRISLQGIGGIDRRRTSIDINRENQVYSIAVCYDFIGSWQLSRRLSEETVSWINHEVLPIGYKAVGQSGGWQDTQRRHHLWLLFLITLVIYAMLAIAFESLRSPFAVILMIPESFIGLFLVFGLSDFSFDQGGFAALVMLCGITVNAGIYLVCEYKAFKRQGLEAYKRAFSAKITPISLTIISTTLGLLPFLSDGPTEVFWFDFAIGTIGGLSMSVVALLFFLPVFLIRET